MAVDQQTLEVMAAFQRYVKSRALSEIASYTLEDLRRADEVLGHRDINADFRIALRNRMKEIEGKGERKYQSWVRTIGYVVAFAAGVLATLLAAWLGR
jgi:hypothetical protein